MGDLLYWGLLALVLTVFYFKKPRKPVSDKSKRTYVFTFSRLRDRDLLDHLSDFTYPESYIFELIRSDMKGTPVPDLVKSPKANSMADTRSLFLKLNTIFQKDLIDYLDSHGYFYNSYVKSLIRKDMKRLESVSLTAPSKINAAY